ncbi:MAG TPA: sigma-70 family RNA polymerase sigma factor [Bacteroidales bacterium]|nr:sigma-70 family RNA polymerase sigma factor [Bacteroidales bacterium]
MKQEKHYIQRVLRGDVHAFSYLVDMHKSMVYTLALRMLKNPENAEELAQDVFVKAFQSMEKFKFESKFSTWLYRITYNAAISILRKKHVEMADIDDVQLPENNVVDTFNAITELKNYEQRTYVKQALEQLKDEDALIITLFYLDENSVEEISVITGFTVANVKVKLHRARKRFYDALKLILKDEVKMIL